MEFGLGTPRMTLEIFFSKITILFINWNQKKTKLFTIKDNFNRNNELFYLC